MIRWLARSIAVGALGLLLLPSGSERADAGAFPCFDGRTSEGTGTTVALSRSCFTPTVLRIEPGTEVTFVNRDPYPHDVTGATGAWSSGTQLATGERFSVTFEDEGVFPYSCYLHPGMTGVIAVGDANAPLEGASAVSVNPVAAGEDVRPQDADPASSSAVHATGPVTARGIPWGVAALGALLGLGAGAGIGVAVRRRPVG